MKSLIKYGAIAALLALGACNDKGTKDHAGKPDKPVAQDGSPVCPPENVLADISTYSTDVPDPNLPQAEWFAQNGKKKGVHTTPSGLQYRINKSGPKNGPNPKPTNVVRVNYHGQFVDGKTFDSSYRRHKDIEFPLNRVIKGWTEGVGLMKPCDAWTFYIPSDLAYGPNGKGPIPPATPLIFHVQLIEVK